jgi:hypothetical protein
MNGLGKDNWVSILTSSKELDINLKKSKLESQGIEAIIFNHQDSMLKSLNDTDFMVSLYVHENDVENAKKVIE